MKNRRAVTIMLAIAVAAACLTSTAMAEVTRGNSTTSQSVRPDMPRRAGGTQGNAAHITQCPALKNTLQAAGDDFMRLIKRTNGCWNDILKKLKAQGVKYMTKPQFYRSMETCQGYQADQNRHAARIKELWAKYRAKGCLAR